MVVENDLPLLFMLATAAAVSCWSSLMDVFNIILSRVLSLFSPSGETISVRLVWATDDPRAEFGLDAIVLAGWDTIGDTNDCEFPKLRPVGWLRFPRVLKHSKISNASYTSPAPCAGALHNILLTFLVSIFRPDTIILIYRSSYLRRHHRPNPTGILLVQSS